MALFQQSLDRCLDNSVSAPGKRRRALDDEDSGPDHRGSDEGGARGRKKRVKQEASGPLFACPFCKHDPAKYKSVRTCLGPGWVNVHRVKEHVYRNHSMRSLKNCCLRCFEHFDKPESLKSHQRAEVSCKLKQKSEDTITEEQEKLLRARSKPHSSEEEKWKEMYRILFPDETVPSPYFDPDSEASPKTQRSRFKSMEECKEFLRTELPRLVRPVVEQFVDRLLEDIQTKVNQKTAEIVRDVEIKVLRTFHFQEEEPAEPLSALESEPSQPLSPRSPEMAKMDHLVQELQDDPIYVAFCNSIQFDMEDLLADNAALGCGGFGSDSAYFTSSDAASFDTGGITSYAPRFLS
ncbi:hypothetical protein VTK56DRAFT_8818 [Thermocarpiscus australiensis]